MYVDDSMFEGEPLALVDGDGPCKFEWILLEHSHNAFFHLLRTRIHLVARILPCVDVYFDALIIIKRTNHYALVREFLHCAEHSIKVAVLHIVLDKHHLRALFEHKLFVGRVRRLGKYALHAGFKHILFCGEAVQLLGVVFSGLMVVGHKTHIASILGRFEIGHIALIEKAEHFSICRIATHTIEKFYEMRVALTVNMMQFDGGITALIECSATEKIRCRIVGAQQFPFVVFHYGSQLLEVANEQQLYTAEWLERSAIVAQ